jgi:hypothetical protein
MACGAVIPTLQTVVYQTMVCANNLRSLHLEMQRMDIRILQLYLQLYLQQKRVIFVV